MVPLETDDEAGASAVVDGAADEARDAVADEDFEEDDDRNIELESVEQPTTGVAPLAANPSIGFA